MAALRVARLDLPRQRAVIVESVTPVDIPRALYARRAFRSLPAAVSAPLGNGTQHDGGKPGTRALR
jgi:hypothetical protein